MYLSQVAAGGEMTYRPPPAPKGQGGGKHKQVPKGPPLRSPIPVECNFLGTGQNSWLMQNLVPLIQTHYVPQTQGTPFLENGRPP